MDDTLLQFLKARLLTHLYAQFGDAVRAQATVIMTDGLPPDIAQEFVREEARGMLAFPGVSHRAVRQKIRQLRAEYARRPDLLEEERSFGIMVHTEQSVAMIMETWLQSLLAAQTRPGMKGLLLLSYLDDAMLPPMDEAAKAAFDRTCRLFIHLNGEEVRAGLRAMRARLPEGELLHPDAARLLGLTLPEAADA